MSQDFLANYKAKHQHPLNRLSHSIGIPLIVISLPLFFFNWRWALALVALGLYVAASLLMQHSLGPRVLGGWPLFAIIGYGLALWLTWRIARGVAAAERE